MGMRRCRCQWGSLGAGRADLLGPHEGGQEERRQQVPHLARCPGRLRPGLPDPDPAPLGMSEPHVVHGVGLAPGGGREPLGGLEP